jgi:DUF4097 and DUF4098 domain-containing protein YvlB
MELRLPNGNRVTVKDAAVEIVMGTTTITVEGDGTIKLEAAGDISLKANGALKLESAMSATLKAPMVTVEASGPAELKGAITTISGLTTFRAG